LCDPNRSITLWYKTGKGHLETPPDVFPVLAASDLAAFIASSFMNLDSRRLFFKGAAALYASP